MEKTEFDIEIPKVKASTGSSDRKLLTMKTQWVEIEDENSGQSYFYHPRTHETRWENPNADTEPSELVVKESEHINPMIAGQ